MADIPSPANYSKILQDEVLVGKPAGYSLFLKMGQNINKMIDNINQFTADVSTVNAHRGRGKASIGNVPSYSEDTWVDVITVENLSGRPIILSLLKLNCSYYNGQTGRSFGDFGDNANLYLKNNTTNYIFNIAGQTIDRFYSSGTMANPIVDNSITAPGSYTYSFYWSVAYVSSSSVYHIDDFCVSGVEL